MWLKRLLAISWPRLVVIIFYCVANSNCSQGENSDYFVVPGTKLLLPRQPGWIQDYATTDEDPTYSGIALRLIRQHSVTGSPRMDVVVDSKKTKNVKLDDFLKQNLRELALLEKNGNIRIESVNKQPIKINNQKGYRVRHEYILLAGEAAITQLSTFIILEGRGIAITVVGRTELYTPLARNIEAMLTGIKLNLPQPKVKEPTKPKNPQPIDLGKLGGNNN
ncbi:MAG: hypothetical protein JW841_07725 [Deltaproteobacteria bacterium]|nr:hypothetical protein [Deltaproteobacteria bacterium]